MDAAFATEYLLEVGLPAPDETAETDAAGADELSASQVAGDPTVLSWARAM